MVLVGKLGHQRVVRWALTQSLLMQPLLCPRNMSLLNLRLGKIVPTILPSSLFDVEQTPAIKSLMNLLQEYRKCHQTNVIYSLLSRRNWLQDNSTIPHVASHTPGMNGSSHKEICKGRFMFPPTNKGCPNKGCPNKGQCSTMQNQQITFTTTACMYYRCPPNHVGTQPNNKTGTAFDKVHTFMKDTEQHTQ